MPKHERTELIFGSMERIIEQNKLDIQNRY